LQAAAITAAQAADARLVVMDNVYMYGRADGRPFTEDRGYDAHTRKGRVRAQMARDLMAAHDAGRVQVTVGRASDFFGPRAGQQSLIGDWVIPPALADKTASVMGDPDMPHTYTFIPTSARTSPASANTTTRSDASGTCPVPRRARRATWSRSSTRPPAPGRG
jgi:nucleoside-diphosphate-sugar epimerase